MGGGSGGPGSGLYPPHEEILLKEVQLRLGDVLSWDGEARDVFRARPEGLTRPPHGREVWHVMHLVRDPIAPHIRIVREPRPGGGPCRPLYLSLDAVSWQPY